MTPSEYEKKIKKYDYPKLVKLWKQVLLGNTPGWDAGMAFQYLIIRAFEIEKNEVVYPYSVKIPKTLTDLEQIDGFVYLKGENVPVLIESKHYDKNIDIAPIDKMNSQLDQRPNGTIGALFATKGYTVPALDKHSRISKQTILLWEQEDIEYCISKRKFTAGMKAKYRFAIEHGIKTLDLQTHLKKK